MSKDIIKDQCVHRGHRARMRKRFAENGGNDFLDHELLEMLLYHVIPRANTNELAHNLLNEFGTLRDVLNADPARIERVTGAGKATAGYLSLLFAIRKRTDTQKYIKTKFVADSLVKVGNYLVDHFRDRHNEEFCMMLLDGSLTLIEFKTVGVGSVNSTPVDVKALTKHALLSNATHVILAHNHPSGPALPSERDRQLTAQLEAALGAVGISLLDHLIVNDVGFKPTMYLRALGTETREYDGLYEKFYNGS